MHKRHGKKGDRVNGLAVAFGLGLLLASFCSLRLALFWAAAALIFMGLTKK